MGNHLSFVNNFFQEPVHELYKEKPVQISWELKPETKRNLLTGTNMPTPDQCEATYHCGIGSLLTAAYRREFSMQEKGRCKTKFPAFDER